MLKTIALKKLLVQKLKLTQAMQDAEEFVFSLAVLPVATVSVVKGCRQNESSNSWSKHKNNPQVINRTPGN